MRRGSVLLPKPRALTDAEAVLLINNGKAEVLVLHLLFNERMCTNGHRNTAIRETRQYLFAFLAFYAARQERNRDAHWLQQSFDANDVLLRENFRRRHDAGLKAIVHCQQRTHYRNNGFSTTHIALQKAV